MKPHLIFNSNQLAAAIAVSSLLCVSSGNAAEAAASNVPNPPEVSADAPVADSGVPAKPPSKHRKVVRGPVKPPETPSKPQEQVRRLR